MVMPETLSFIKTRTSMLLTIGLAIIFNSCTKCPPDNEKYFEIAPYFREPLNTYTGLDTLKFKSETGLIYTFYGKGTDSGYNKVTTFTEDNCGTNTRNYKKYCVYLYESPTYPTPLTYGVGVPPTENGEVPELQIEINQLLFISNPRFPPLGSPSYMQHLIIDSIEYNNVKPMYYDYNNYKNVLIYFSLKEGIIKITFKDGKTLTKIN